MIAPTPPTIAGLTWQLITSDNLAALAEMATKCHLADGGLNFMLEPDNLKDHYFQDGPGATIGAFSADKHLIACATVHIVGDLGRKRAIIAGQVRPDYRHRGIGTYLMHWSQVQAKALFTTHPVDKQLLQIATESLTEPTHDIYLAHGFEPIMEELVMWRNLDQSLLYRPLPPDVTLTTWQPDQVDQFFQAYQASFQERPGFPGYTATEWITNRNEDENFKPEWSLLACRDNVPLGFLTSAANPPYGFVVQVGVIPVRRRSGLGSGLMVEAMRRMQADGMVALQLTVNVNNPGAIQTYTQLEFTTIGRRARYERLAKYCSHFGTDS